MLEDFQSRAVGVAQAARAAVARPSPAFAVQPFVLWFPRTVGVGHMATAATSAGELRRRSLGQSPRRASLDFGVGQRPLRAIPVSDSLSPAGPGLVLLVRSDAVGVGYRAPCDAEPAASQVGAANVGNGYSRPDSIKPEAGKLAEYLGASPPISNDNCDVLSEDDPGPKLAYQPRKFVEQAAASAFQTFTRAGRADVLAGEAPAKDVDTLDPFSAHLADVFVLLGVGPVLAQHAPAVGGLLALPRDARLDADVGEALLDPKFEPADAREERSDGDHPALPNMSICRAQRGASERVIHSSRDRRAVQ